MLRNSPLHIISRLPRAATALSRTAYSSFDQRPFTTSSPLYNTENAIPDLRNLEQRWPKMKEFDQTDIVEYLEERAQGDWKELTISEKRALYYIYFGNWGPRSSEQQKSTSQFVLASLGAGIVMISLGIAIYNYALDLEREEKLNILGKRAEEELKKRQKQAQRAQENEANKWWKLW